MPTNTDSGVPERLVSWVKNQRRARNLTDAQVTILDAVPGWNWAPREDAWDERIRAFEWFVVENGRLPRTRATESSERALAYWTSRARRVAQRGLLPYRRLVTLNAVVRLVYKSDRAPGAPLE